MQEATYPHPPGGDQRNGQSPVKKFQTIFIPMELPCEVWTPVKMTFAKGAALKDPSRLFNSSLEGNTRRAIDFREGEEIDEKALKTLVRAAVTLNQSKANG